MKKLDAEKTTASSRLSRSCTLRDGGLARWQQATIFVIGAGNIGQRVAHELLISGASVSICDFDKFSLENMETQLGTPGKDKVVSLIERTNRTAPNRLTGFRCDVRHIGVGEIAKAQLMIDCSDDPALALPLTRISNGLGVPLLRAAIDGSGATEMGRVACSHGGGGYSCQICSFSMANLLASTPRTPCPSTASPSRAPTLAGGAIGAVIAGTAVIQAQRLVSGNDIDLVLDRELLMDLSNVRLTSLRRLRCEDCLSGHVRWDLKRIWMSAKNTTLRDLFYEAEQLLGNQAITLEPFAHPLYTLATCHCGDHQAANGTRWADCPQCNCGAQMSWASETTRDRISRDDLRELGIEERTLLDLGMPRRGAMFVARATGQPPMRFVLD
jgi:molybdopterin/thiamine biosynthesis adenylyltransferase